MLRPGRHFKAFSVVKILTFKLMLCLSLFFLFGISHGGDDEQAPFSKERKKMIGLIEQDVIRTSRLIGKKEFNPRVMEIMGQVPRHEFVPGRQKRFAYENRPLPIGYGQTISQPYIVALMTDLLRPRPEDVVLEVGTGSGYQAAVLSGLVSKVFTIEIIPELAEAAKNRLNRLGYKNIQARMADGYYGWEEHGPFDGIVVTAAAGRIPPPLIHQLKPGGRMIIPVGSPFLTQHLVLVEKDESGKIRTRQILPVRFVPFTRGH